MTTPRVVQTPIAAYLRLVDTYAPGLVDGLYLVGSVALDDFQRGAPFARQMPFGATCSDIDFFAVTSRPPTADDTHGLRRTHATLRRKFSRPFFDGLYLLQNDLANDPTGLRLYTRSRMGQIYPGNQEPPSPVGWHELADHGITVRGSSVSDISIWKSEDALITWCRSNLSKYWRRFLGQCRRRSSTWYPASLTSYVTAWAVLSVARADYTIATGDVTSKTEAGRYALRQETRWQRIIEEALRVRTGRIRRSLYMSPLRRRRDTLAYVEGVLLKHGVS